MRSGFLSSFKTIGSSEKLLLIKLTRDEKKQFKNKSHNVQIMGLQHYFVLLLTCNLRILIYFLLIYKLTSKEKAVQMCCFHYLP